METIDNLNPVIKRIAVKADCFFHTPALIGSGFAENTDGDILRNNKNEAFLPGSTVAGVLRGLCAEAECLFGGQDGVSPLWVLDSKLQGGVIELDGVALDYENKVALEKKKYDFEAVDKGAAFELRFLLTIRKNDNADEEDKFETLLKKLLYILKHGDIAFGAKTKRGFGQVVCTQVLWRSFELKYGNKSALKAWLDFDWKGNSGWEEADVTEYADDYSKLVANLNLDGSIMIRDTRNIYENDTADAPDYAHIKVGGKPAILGTSWAGAFRAGLFRLLKDRFQDKTQLYLNEVFGYVADDKDDDSEAIASRVTFGASFLEAMDSRTDGYRNITRVKIDRFTGGAADGALFTEKPWYGGKTALEIRFPKEREDIKELLLLGLYALDKGLIQIGGEASVGRGFFSVKEVTVDGAEAHTNKPKQKLISAINAIAKAGEKP